MQTCRFAERVVAVFSIAVVAGALSFAVTPVAGQSCEEEWLAGPHEGVPGVQGQVGEIVEWDPDGAGPESARLVVGGNFVVAGASRSGGIASWNPSARGGAGEWTGFGGHLFFSVVDSLTVWDPDAQGPAPEQLIGGGLFRSSEGVVYLVARWDPEANAGSGDWLPLGVGMHGICLSLIQWNPDGLGPAAPQIVAGGNFTAGTSGVNHVARWDPSANDGAGDWIGFSSALTPKAASLITWDSDGAGPIEEQLVVGGSVSNRANGESGFIARWNPSADADGDWVEIGTPLRSSVRAVVPWDPDGAGPGSETLVVGGNNILWGPMSSISVAYWDPEAEEGIGAWIGLQYFPGNDHMILSKWDPDGPGPLGEVLLGGLRRPYFLGEAYTSMLYWDPNATGYLGGWQPFATIVNGSTGAFYSWDADADGTTPSQLVVGGRFSYVDGVGAASIARFDQSAGDGAGDWHAFGTGMVGEVYDLSEWDPDGPGPAGSQLIATGLLVTEGVERAYGAARLDPSVPAEDGPWRSLGATAEDYIVRAEQWDSDGAGPAPPSIILAGLFPSPSDAQYHELARWNPPTANDPGGLRPFEEVDTLPGWYATMMTWNETGDEAAPNTLVVVYGINLPNGGTQSAVVRWDTHAAEGQGSWRAMGGVSDSGVGPMFGWDADGPGPMREVLVGIGQVPPIGDEAVDYIARWNPSADAWRPLGTGATRPVYKMTSWDPDGDGPGLASLVVVGGIDGATVNAWVPSPSGSGGIWRPMGAGLESGVGLMCAVDFDGNGPQPETLLAQVFYSVAGERPWLDIARWDAAALEGAGRWRALAPIPDGEHVQTSYVNSLHVWDPDGPGRTPPRLAIGGYFPYVSNRVSPHIAFWGRPPCLCPGDSDGDLAVNFRDITSVLEHWGTQYTISTGLGDTSSDGVVNFADIESVLANFNQTCE